MNCKQCGKILESNDRLHHRGFCSYGCNDKYYQFHSKPNCSCVICGTPMYIKPSRQRKVKTGFVCSEKCNKIHRSIMMLGENNHQYGLKAEKNSSWKGGKRISSCGYILINKSEHPFRNQGNYVFEHRLIVEENCELFDDKYFIIIDGKKYLNPDVEVHHINENRQDNRIENLIPLSKAEHIKIHREKQKILRDDKGRIKNTIRCIGVKIYDDGKIPEYKTKGAACADCYAAENITIKKGTRSLVKLGFGLDLPCGYEAVIRPRSGLSKKGIDVAIGTIDYDFKSEISANVINNSSEDFVICIGDRICQLAINKISRASFIEVLALSTSERGSNGFGSTGL